jgi:hypothetical protein
MPNTPEARLKIVAENLARAALSELKRDVEGAGTAASGASLGFGKMVFAHGNLIASSAGARRGVNLIENALQTLTAQAIGVPGPVGKIAQGFGLLGAGSLVVTGAVAGAGVLALAYRTLTQDARAAAEAADQLTDSLKKQSTGAQLREISASLTRAHEEIERGPKIFGLFRDDAVRPGEIGDPILHLFQLMQRREEEKGGEKAVGSAMAVRGVRAEDHTRLIRDLEREGDLVGATATETARLKAQWLGLTDVETTNYVAAAARIERLKEAENRRLERLREENGLLEKQKDLISMLTDIGDDVEAFAA